MKLKYIFGGSRETLDHYMQLFPSLNDNIKQFYECSESVLFEKINAMNLKNELIVITIDDFKIIELTGNNKCIPIYDFVIKGLIESWIMPVKVRLEASTLCQLNCKGCYMRLNNYGTVGKGYLKFYDFKKFVDNHPYIHEIELSNSGEIFLNPDLVQIMEYSFLKNITLTAVNGVNFNNVTDEQLEALVKYNFNYLMISIDGATEDTYATYRKNGSFKRVINNIKKLQKIKKMFNSQSPKIVWQYIIMDETESEIKLAKEIAKELEIPIWFKLTWDEMFIPKNPDYIFTETSLQYHNRREYLVNTKHVYLGNTTCSQMFISPQINWDGKLLGCCELFEYDYNVNVFEVGLKNALNDPIYLNTKKMLLKQKYDKNFSNSIPCLNCKKHKQRLEVAEEFNPFDFLLGE